MKDDLLIRIQAWCAKAERSSAEASALLLRWGVSPEEIQAYLDRLVADNFIRDDRYAESFVLEKWRLQGWGKVKIAHALSAKGFGEEAIATALLAIPEADYALYREELMLARAKSLSPAPRALQAGKLFSFAMRRGLEEEWIKTWLQAQGYLDEMLE